MKSIIVALCIIFPNGKQLRFVVSYTLKYSAIENNELVVDGATWTIMLNEKGAYI